MGVEERGAGTGGERVRWVCRWMGRFIVLINSPPRRGPLTQCFLVCSWGEKKGLKFFFYFLVRTFFLVRVPIDVS